LREGDQLVSIGAQELGDPLTLAQRCWTRRAGDRDPVRARRSPAVADADAAGAGESLGEPLFYGALLPIESLGIALPLENVVGRPAGRTSRPSRSDIGGRNPEFRMELADEDKLAEIKKLFPGYDRPVYLDRALSAWQYVHAMFVQRAVPGTKSI
jgi:hypothetical protein